jgi:hypothetical protein
VTAAVEAPGFRRSSFDSGALMGIERLNALMFEAEAQRDCDGVPWDRFLGDVLADDFAVRRSAPAKPLEDKRAFLAAARAAEPAERRIVSGSVRVWEGDSLATVSSVVELEGRPEQFTNTRVFQRRRHVRLPLPLVAGHGRREGAT